MLPRDPLHPLQGDFIEQPLHHLSLAFVTLPLGLDQPRAHIPLHEQLKDPRFPVEIRAAEDVCEGAVVHGEEPVVDVEGAAQAECLAVGGYPLVEQGAGEVAAVGSVWGSGKQSLGLDQPIAGERGGKP